ncbi:MAG: DNA primase [Clostridia bacterium]|nr:DNA primase [Clostridia bacterium]
MPRFSDEFLTELRMRTDIEQLISAYVPLKRRGKNLVGLCPFHNEKTPSFTVYPETQSYYCFGCGAGGEAVNFIRGVEHLDFTEAVRFLCDRAGMRMPTEGYDDSLAQKRRRMYEINREAARFFHETLLSPQGAAALQYFRSRGYSNKTITRFGLGYAPDTWSSLRDHLRQKGYSYEEQFEANLVQRSEKNERKSYYDNFRGRVIVPIIDARGNVVAFGGRVLDDSKPKYINTSDTLVYKKSLGVFGLNYAKNSKAGSLILVEGYMDAIALHQAGFDNAIACLGTALTGEMARLLLRYTDEIVLCYDADEAGQKATQRAIGIFTSVGAKLRVVRLSGGKDPDEILKNYGAERFRSLLDGAANDIEFALLKARDGLDLTSDDGRLKYLNNAVQHLSTVSDPLAVEVYASRLAQEVDVDKATVVSRVSALKKRRRSFEKAQHYKDVQQSSMKELTRAAMQSGATVKALHAEERILALLYANPDFWPPMRETLGAGAFSDETNARIFSALTAQIDAQESLDLTHLSDALSQEDISRFSGISKRNERLPGSKKELADCVQVLQTERERQKNRAVDVSHMSNEEFLQAMKNANQRKQ